MRAWWVAALLLTGCLHDETVPCGDLRCPKGDICVDGACASADSVAACAGFVDGDVCTSTSVPSGTCRGRVCTPIECGNGFEEPGEVCDDGNLANGDGCSRACDSTETCGNSIIDVSNGEECDRGQPGLSSDGCSSTCASERAAWRDVTPLPIAARAGQTMVYDSDRGVVVVFGGYSDTEVLGDTWERDGTTWHHRVPIQSPPARMYATMAYDTVRHRVVLFGGFGTTGGLADTWEWDGTTWLERTPAVSPGPRRSAGMAYDEQRGRTVLFGGMADTFFYDDTWDWDGTTWLKRQPATSPPELFGHAMTYDASTHTVVLYGGKRESGVDPRETWDFDGTNWTKRTSAAVPASNFGVTLTYDRTRGRLVTFGGWAPPLWEWVGNNWVSRTETGPPPTYDAQLVFDAKRDRILLFGGASTGIVPPSTWEWDGATWVEFPAVSANPQPRYGPGLVYSTRRGAIVMFGGGGASTFTDMWQWNGDSWDLLSANVNMPPRFRFAMAYDEARERAVLFGGYAVGSFLGDTWEWDDATSTWAQVTTAVAPPGRLDAGIAYDSARKRTVLFGGIANFSGTGDLGDTWEWDGSTWTEVTPATSPPPTRGPLMSYDPVRARVVLLADDRTWEWDGTTWTDRTPAASVPARIFGAMAYDPQRRRIVVHGGSSNDTALSDVWEWDGTSWQLLAPESASPARDFQGLVYDSVHRQMMMFAGQSFTGILDDTLVLEWSSSRRTEGCRVSTADDDGDSLSGCQDPDCWGRCTPRCPPGVSCDPSYAHCGDGVCEPNEDHLICPDDC